MFQKYSKKIFKEDSFFNDKENKNNFIYNNNNNHNNINKNKKNTNQLKIVKKSNGTGLNTSSFNNSNLNGKYINQNHKNNSYNKPDKFQNNLSTKKINNNNYGKIFKYTNKGINSYLNKNNKIENIKNNSKVKKNNNISKSFINAKREKSPLLIKDYNNNIYSNHSIPNPHNRIRSTNLKLNIIENRSMRSNNSIFQPINIFSRFKRAKSNNNDELLKNKQLLKKFLQEENKKKNINQNNKINKNKNNKLIDNRLSSSNIINKTNDTTLLNSGNLLNVKANNNIAYGKNNYVHEIDFYFNGINLKNKKKIFKGKKIKCMHDLSKTGLSGDDKKVNQDNYFIFKNFVQGFDYIFMGVCDGHGYYGHEVSGYIKENLPMDLNHMIKAQKLDVLKDDLSPIIKKAFILENKSLLRNKQIDSDLSGSTCVSVIYTPEKLIIANLGDSRCILGSTEIDEKKEEKMKKWNTTILSRDHKPTIPEEEERILKKGGRIRPMKDEDGEFIGPLRVYMKDKDMPGLAMTRSFGDYFGSIAGVISEPEVTQYFFKEEDKFIVLASDGLFEFMENEEMLKIIKEYYEKNDIVGCCEYLYKESTRKWLKEEEDAIDDITIILVFLDNVYKEVDI